jgi:hypothetical protein
MKNRKLFLLAALAPVLAAFLMPHSSASARDDLDKPLPKEPSMKGDGARVQEYDEIVTPDMESAWSVANRARVSLKNGNVSRAISLCNRAMKMNDDDMDIHCIYAEALEAKIERQVDRDPELFKKCLHEWILVYRNEVGMEKGMTFKGLNPMGNMYNDDEHGNLAKKHLIRLTGYAPKLWETDNHFLTRVTKDTETTVSAKIRMPSASSKHEADDDDQAAEEAPRPKPRKLRSAPADEVVNVDDEPEDDAIPVKAPKAAAKAPSRAKASQE